MRLAVLPAVLIAVVGAGVVAYVMSARTGAGAAGDSTTSAGGGADGAVLWSVLAVAAALVCAVVGAAAYFASAEARRHLERVAELRRSVVRGTDEVRGVLRELKQGGRLPAQWRRDQPAQGPQPPAPAGRTDAYEALAREVALAQQVTESAVSEAAALMRSNSSESEEKVEVFVNLARRLQSLVHREIELLDELENEVEDPDLLKSLFHVDHLATRIRRHAENLAVLGGAISRRQWSQPVSLTEVLRSSIAEVEQYPRVKLVPPIEGRMGGHAVADVIHLLAELVENATVFSAPQTQVLLRAQYVTSGLAVEVEDRGLGMTGEEQERMNSVLSDPERIDVGELLQDGRIGLFVVSALAQRHGIVVQLQGNIYGGVQAVLVLPHELLGEMASSTADGQDQGQAELERLRSQQHGGGGESGGEAVPATPSRQAPSATYHQPRSQAQPQPAPQQQPPSQLRPHTQPPMHPQPQPQALSPQPHPEGRAGQQSQPQPRIRPEQGGEGTGAPMSSTSPAASAAPAAPRGERPALPKRRRQEHLAPELRDAPPAPGDASPQAAWDAAGRGHDPGLMAAFQRGTLRAEAPDGASSAERAADPADRTYETDAGPDGTGGTDDTDGAAGPDGTGPVAGEGSPRTAR